MRYVSIWIPRYGDWKNGCGGKLMPGNRQQRRAAKHKGKRPGETYADVLTKRKMIEEAVRESVLEATCLEDGSYEEIISCKKE